MSDIFREVDEALSREKAAKFWKSYGPTLIAAAVIMVASTAATTAYRTWDSSRNKAETSKLVIAAEEKDMAAAMEKAATDTRDGHKAIALLNAAAKHAEKKEFAKASELYNQVSEDKSAPDDLRDLATIFYVRSALLQKEEADDKALLDRLLPVAKNDKSAFHLQAKLEAALLYGEILKDYTSALDLLKGFQDDSVTGSLQEKAAALKQVYTYELAKKPETTSPQKQ
jgi:hypothetical protein